MHLCVIFLTIRSAESTAAAAAAVTAVAVAVCPTIAVAATAAAAASVHGMGKPLLNIPGVVGAVSFL